MSNAKRLALAPESFTGLLEQLGARVTTQSGFIRVDGPEGRRMYVARGKTVATVHLSGWESQKGDSVPLAKSPSSKVTHEMRFDEADPVSQMRLFARLYAEMMALPPVSKKGAPKDASSPAAAPLVVPPELIIFGDQLQAEQDEAAASEA